MYILGYIVVVYCISLRRGVSVNEYYYYYYYHCITRGNGAPQTFAQVKVETNTGSSEALSSSKKCYNIMEQIMYLYSAAYRSRGVSVNEIIHPSIQLYRCDDYLLPFAGILPQYL
jgi:hypothetical protein